jgi:hypothetical protein
MIYIALIESRVIPPQLEIDLQRNMSAFEVRLVPSQGFYTQPMTLHLIEFQYTLILLYSASGVRGMFCYRNYDYRVWCAFDQFTEGKKSD